MGDWIGERLDDLFSRLPGVDAPSAPGAPLGGGVGSLLGWLLVMAALVVVVIVVVLVIRRWVPRVREPSDRVTHLDTEHRRSASQWASDAERYEAEGNWKLAIRARFRELVRTLVDRSQVADLPGRTTGEMLADLTTTTPDAVDAFHTAALLFELPWYADVPTGETENARFRAAAESVLAAEVSERIDAGPSERVGRVEIRA
ncbi:MAG: DUF4129 domain-containing protein [Microthrixaceae bacterium]|nr:DUF4129 domain-containing protein [Microthrixaceae bacterium]